jgi:subtilisin family serine protease
MTHTTQPARLDRHGALLAGALGAFLCSIWLGCMTTAGPAGKAATAVDPVSPATVTNPATAGTLGTAATAAGAGQASDQLDTASPATPAAGADGRPPNGQVQDDPLAPDQGLPRVMVTLAPAPPPIWNQVTLDLERTYRLRTVFAWSMQSVGERCIVFEASSGDRSVTSLLRRLAADPRVELAQPVQRFSTQDAHFTSTPVPLQHSAQALRLAQAHHWATGKGVRVAVIDTGMDVDHPDLRGRIAKVGDFVDRPGHRDLGFNSDIHGTAVAGVIAAALNSEIGLVGVAPDAQVFALKACWQERPGAREAVCDSYTLAKAVDFAILQGAQVLNFSLAGPPDPLLAKLIAAALRRGIVVVAADGPDVERSFPASEPGVLAVAGSDDLQGGLRFPARRLAAGTLAAPGVDILTTVPHGHYDFFSGSSFAAAQVSGVVALLLQRTPSLTASQIAALFHRTGHPIPAASAAPTTPHTAVASTTGGSRPPTPIDQIDACAALAAHLGGACS